MAGCRPLTEEEIILIHQNLSVRDDCLFTIGIKTGYRIQEILSLKISDVYQYGSVVKYISVAKKYMKGKDGTRLVPLHEDARIAIEKWVILLMKQSKITVDSPLFPSRKNLNKSLTRIQAWHVLDLTFKKLKLQGPLGTHAMRKTFANKVYPKLNCDLVKTQQAMGHAQVNSTARYIAFAMKDIEDAILS